MEWQAQRAQGRLREADNVYHTQELLKEEVQPQQVQAMIHSSGVTAGADTATAGSHAAQYSMATNACPW